MPKTTPDTHDPILDDAAEQIMKRSPVLTCPHCTSGKKPSKSDILDYLKNRWPHCCRQQMTLTTTPPPKKEKKPTPKKDPPA